MTGHQLLKQLVRPVRTYVEAEIGPIRQWMRVRRERNAPRSIGTAIRVIEHRWNLSSTAATNCSEHGPVFILSAGWRSGSTLIQRLVCSAGTILIWGEPYDHCDLIRSLALSLTGIREHYPPDHYLAYNKLPEADSAAKQVWEGWIANLYPDPVELLQAHRDFMTTLFQKPAKQRGYQRWGLKEVRLGIEHAYYLKWLFPNATFLFLIRNPYDAYTSFRPHRGWYDRFPDRPVLTPRQFGAHWRSLCEGFVTNHRTVDGILVFYEELLADKSCVDRLANHLHLVLDNRVLRHKVGSSLDKREAKVPRYEVRALRRVVEPLASELGYGP